MKKSLLILAFLLLGIVVHHAQDWEPSVDFIGLNAYCSLNGYLVGTSN